jgi:hypothetical protein
MTGSGSGQADQARQEPATSEAPDRARPPQGYTIVLPPAWARIPVRRDSDAAIKRILDESFRQLPRDRVAQYRRELEERLRKMVEQAREAGGLDLYLPIDHMHGATAAASLLVSEVSFASVEQVDPMLVVARLAADGESTPVTVHESVGVRTERTVAADPERDVEFASRRVDYVLPVPDDPERWLALAFSTLGGGNPGDEYADVLVELFDAMMTTFRWVR